MLLVNNIKFENLNQTMGLFVIGIDNYCAWCFIEANVF